MTPLRQTSHKRDRILENNNAVWKDATIEIDLPNNSIGERMSWWRNRACLPRSVNYSKGHKQSWKVVAHKAWKLSTRMVELNECTRHRSNYSSNVIYLPYEAIVIQKGVSRWWQLSAWIHWSTINRTINASSDDIDDRAVQANQKRRGTMRKRTHSLFIFFSSLFLKVRGKVCM